MELQLFSWDDWDQMDTASFTFMPIQLKVDIGKFPAGTKFEWAAVDYQAGTLQLGNGEDVAEFKLGLTVIH